MTLYEHRQEIKESSMASLRDLAIELRKVVDEELQYRLHPSVKIIRDITSKVKLTPNNYKIIDPKARAYDDLRLCHICRGTCMFSAIACECNSTKVACLRHAHNICKCPKQKNYFLGLIGTNLLVFISIKY